MTPGWGPVETFIVKIGGWSSVCGLIVAYAPVLAGWEGWGKYGPLVGLLAAGAVSVAKLYLSNTATHIEVAVKQEKITDAATVLKAELDSIWPRRLPAQIAAAKTAIDDAAESIAKGIGTVAVKKQQAVDIEIIKDEIEYMAVRGEKP